MNEIHLIMPMAGRGSRFAKNGEYTPKPLIEIAGKPFFYWSALSVKKTVALRSLTFVVLREHEERFQISRKILTCFPEAKIRVIPEVLPGPVLSCLCGAEEIRDGLPVLFNDCDHMFWSESLKKTFLTSDSFPWDGGLLTFHSTGPQYSYVLFDEKREAVGTVEKQVVSDRAICGAYLFRNADVFRAAAAGYLANGKDSEFFMSGLYNELHRGGLSLKEFPVDFHVEFGTPEEFREAQDSPYFHVLETKETL